MESDSSSLDHRGLVYQYHEQLYRLALLVCGAPAPAAALVERSYAALDPHAANPEHDLLRGLLKSSRRPQRWRPAAADVARAQTDAHTADAIVGALARLGADERLAVGLFYLRGLAADEIAVLLGTASPAATLAAFRADVARSLENAPPEELASVRELDRWLDGQLDEAEALEIRRSTLEDNETRALRDAVLRVRSLLPQALPALFAVAAPPNLLQRLLRPTEPRRRERRPAARRGALPLLTLGIVALAALIVFGPNLLRHGPSAPTQGAPASAADILDASIARFDQAPLSAGVLHERYRIQVGGEQPRLLERWYDYGSPNRLAATVRTVDVEGPPDSAVSTDGRSIIQYRGSTFSSRPDERPIDFQLSEAEVQAALPILRNNLAPSSLFGNERSKPDISGLFLAQARAESASFLGTTSFLDRPAWLLSYTASQVPRVGFVGAGGSAQVLLTIDRETYALLDVAVVPEGAGEATAQHPWRAEVVELLDSVPDSQFLQAETAGIVRDELGSAMSPSIPQDRFVTLEEARRATAEPLLLPQELPDEAMRGLVIAYSRSNERRYGLLYEGEFQSVFLAPQPLFFNNEAQPWSDEERSAGQYRYRTLEPFDELETTLTADVYQPDAPGQRLTVTLFDAYATAEERQQTMDRIITSLTPVTAENVGALQQSLVPAPVAGGAD